MYFCYQYLLSKTKPVVGISKMVSTYPIPPPMSTAYIHQTEV